MPRREWHLAIPFVLLIAMAVGAAILVNNNEIGDSPPIETAVSRNSCPHAADSEPRRPTEYTDRADPYTGEGPHPMELVAPVTDIYGVHQYESVDLPPEWLRTTATRSCSSASTPSWPGRVRTSATAR